GQLPLMIDPALAAALFIGASMLLSLAVVPVTLSSRLAPALPESAFISPRALYRLSPSGVVGALASGLAQGAFFGLGTFFAQRAGLTASEAAYFILAGVLGGLAGQLPLGRLSDYVDRRKVIAVSYLATAIAALAIVYTSDFGLFALLGLTVIMGASLFSLYALCLAHLNDYVHSGAMVGVSQSLLITFSVGAVLGPILASSVIGVAGSSGLFFFISAVCVLTSAFVFWRMSKRDALPWKDKLDYVAFPNTTPALSEMHPAAQREPDHKIDPQGGAATGPEPDTRSGPSA
ncbi:MAG: MFS transporter, partial [Alphaproteobacteria bacterium]|nr:MFS transporter [Alphaproteobacteria bacterium]